MRKITYTKLVTSDNQTVTSDKAFTGRILAIEVKYDASSLAATDLTVAAKAGAGVDQNVLVLTNNNVDGWYYPVVQNSDNAGSAVTGEYVPFIVSGNLELTTAQNTASLGATVRIMIEEY